METTTALTRQDIPTEPRPSSAWIAPNGDFYYVRPYNHSYVAEELLGTTDDALLARGWVRLSGRDAYVTGHPTQAQLDTLWDVAMAYPMGYERNQMVDTFTHLMGAA